MVRLDREKSQYDFHVPGKYLEVQCQVLVPAGTLWVHYGGVLEVHMLHKSLLLLVSTIIPYARKIPKQ